MPPKALFDNSHRPNKLVMPCCSQCNVATSEADAIVSIVSRWTYPEEECARADLIKLARGIQRSNPALAAEWSAVEQQHWPRERARFRALGVPVPDDAAVVGLGELTVRQLNIFSHKAVLALYFEQTKRPLSPQGRLLATWRQKEDIAAHGIPDFVDQLMPGWGALIQGGWDTRETFEYRVGMDENSQLFACFARLRGGICVFGFAAEAPIDPELNLDGWVGVGPDDPSSLYVSERFSKKL